MDALVAEKARPQPLAAAIASAIDQLSGSITVYYQTDLILERRQ